MINTLRCNEHDDDDEQCGAAAKSILLMNSIDSTPVPAMNQYVDLHLLVDCPLRTLLQLHWSTVNSELSTPTPLLNRLHQLY